MQPGTSRKIAVIALAIMTIALVGVGILILLQIQNSQSSEDADAFGFGSSAVTVNFQPVEEALFATPCNYYLNYQNISFTGNDKLNSYGRGLYRIGSELSAPTDENIAKQCIFKSSNFDDNVFVGIRIKGYKEDSTIDDSPQALYTRVNNEFIASPSGPTELLNQVYFIGPSIVESTNCSATLFHKQNDFEYVVITLYDQPCSESKEYLPPIIEQVANQVENIMAPFLVEGYYDYEIPESEILN